MFRKFRNIWNIWVYPVHLQLPEDQPARLNQDFKINELDLKPFFRVQYHHEPVTVRYSTSILISVLIILYLVLYLLRVIIKMMVPHEAGTGSGINMWYRSSSLQYCISRLLKCFTKTFSVRVNELLVTELFSFRSVINFGSANNVKIDLYLLLDNALQDVFIVPKSLPK